MRILSVSLVAVLGLAACAQDAAPVVTSTDHFALSSLGKGALHATGVTRDKRNGHLWLLASGVGLIETTTSGQFVSEIAFGTHGLNQYPFTDVAMLGDGTFTLTAAGEGYRYDSVAGKLDPFFCLLPAADPIEMENQAVAFDEVSGRIFAAPAYYNVNGHTLVRASLSQYAAGDGSPLGEHDVMQTGVVARGLAFDSLAGGVWALQGSRVTHLTIDGKTDDHTVELTGIEDGVGLTFDGDKMWVLDGADDELRMFPRPTM